ncbi:hypothetical protein AKO1_010533 [Acrasis kona]|uniref:tRNAHis guanylyltransferase catalytic domain-containing protein n=1 Tax=Acrasis kona TaxID=1008807 RepID=A0AAW2YI51_9EUKA
MKRFFSITKSLRSSDAQIHAICEQAKALEIINHGTHIVEDGTPVVVRCDGRAFSKFTKFFRKPFDVNINEAMVLASADVLSEFCGTTAYTFSDEASFVMYYKNTKGGLPFNGKVQKIISAYASTMTARFGLYLRVLVERDQPHLSEQLSYEAPTFDARIFKAPTNKDIFNCFTFRYHDCFRNSLNAFGQSRLGDQAYGKNATNLIRELEKSGHLYYETPDAFRKGTFIKESQVTSEGVNPKDPSKLTSYTRRVLVPNSTIQISGLNEEQVADLVLSQFWPSAVCNKNRIPKGIEKKISNIKNINL